MNRGAGKTSLIIGLAKSLKKSFGYLKPLGDRMIYREKKLWDYDADLITRIFGMKEEPELLTLGFEHSKLRYMYDDEGRKKKLQEMVTHANKDILFVEGGGKMRFGVSLGLDAFSLARDVGGSWSLSLRAMKIPCWTMRSFLRDISTPLSLFLRG